MRKQDMEEGLKAMSAVQLLPRWADIPLELGQWLGVASRLLASEIRKGWPKLSLSEVRKEQLDKFSSSC